MVFGDRFDDRVQEVAWPDSVVRLELFGAVFEQEIDGVQWPALLQELTFGSIVNHAMGGGTWPNTLNWIMVFDEFEPSTVGIA